MPKRKRNDKPGYGCRATQHDVDDGLDRFGKKVVHGKKRLVHAMRTAKRFERQKLGKRISRAKKDGRAEELQRLEEELDFLKTLDISTAAEAHLYKTISKSKDTVTSPGVQDRLNAMGLHREPFLGSGKAGNNVTARLYNYKHLKSEVQDVLDGIRNTLGIKSLNDVPKSSSGDVLPTGKSEEDITGGYHTGAQGAAGGVDSEWEGLSDPQEDGLRDSEDESMKEQSDFEVGPPQLPAFGDVSRYYSPLSTDENRISWDDIAGMNDPDNSAWDEIAGVIDSHNPAYELTASYELDPPSPPLRPKVTGKKPATTSLPQVVGKKLTTTSNSTFLPSLMMSGYWSGSESGQDDIEELQPRKNRRGQRARRQIWEKKYGRNANHIRIQAREDGPPRLGNMGHRNSGMNSNRDTGSTTPLHHNEHQRTSYGNRSTASRSKPGSKIERAKDQPLHPSWEAARKAKEQKQSVAFQGKKVVFD